MYSRNRKYLKLNRDYIKKNICSFINVIIFFKYMHFNFFEPLFYFLCTLYVITLLTNTFLV